MTGPTKVKDSVAALTPSGSSGPWVNVLTISGVVADGTTDVATAINAAIAADPAKVYYFPEGTYLFSSAPLVLKSQTSIVGAGKNLVTIKNTAYTTYAGPLVDISATSGYGQTISGVSFSYKGSTTGAADSIIIKIDGNSYIDISGCNFYDQDIGGSAACTGISIGGWYSPPSGAPNVNSVRIYDNRFNIAKTALQVVGVSDSLYIQNNDMLVNRVGTFTAYSIDAKLCANALIEGNTVKGLVTLSGCQYCSVNNNQFTIGFGPGTNPVLALYNIGGTVFSTYNQLRGNSIVSAYDAKCLYIDSGCTNNSVLDNNFSLPSDVYANVTISADYTVVSSNYIKRGSSGILVTDATGCKVTSNRVLSNSVYGIRCVNIVTAEITDNTISLAYAGIVCDGLERSNISNNNIQNATTFGMNFEVGTYSNQNDLTITDNLVADVGSNGIYLGSCGTNCIVGTNTILNANTTASTYSAIKLLGTQITAVGNSVRRSGTSAQPYYGMNMNGCTSSVAIGNNVSGVVGTAGQYDLTGVTAANNI